MSRSVLHNDDNEPVGGFLLLVFFVAVIFLLGVFAVVNSAHRIDVDPVVTPVKREVVICPACGGKQPEGRVCPMCCGSGCLIKESRQ